MNPHLWLLDPSDYQLPGSEEATSLLLAIA